MRILARKLTVAFTAGCWGGLANSLAVWFSGWLGLTALLWVNIAPSLSPGFLYPRVVWGGLWGVLFLLPWLRRRPLARYVLFSLGPTAGQLLVVFPFQMQQGILGLGLGNLTPLFVVIYNLIWACAAGAWLHVLGEDLLE